MLTLAPGKLSFSQLRLIAERFEPIQLDESCRPGVRACAEAVHKIVAAGQPAYGINTGFGKLAKIHIPVEQLEQLQTNLVRSHAAGMGPLLEDASVRLILALKISALARGYSGVRPELLDSLVNLYNAQIWPCIPAQGSVGASGDLAPLAHLALAASSLVGTLLMPQADRLSAATGRINQRAERLVMVKRLPPAAFCRNNTDNRKPLAFAQSSRHIMLNAGQLCGAATC